MYALRPLRAKRVLSRLLSLGVAARTKAQVEGCGADVCRGKFGPQPIMQTTLGNGMRVAAATRAAPLAAVAVNFLAGTRHELDRRLGVSHFLRNMAGSGGRYTQYMKVRHLQQLGAQLTCTSDRQSVTYLLQCPPWHFREAQRYILDAVSCCEYSDWEVEERRTQVREDLVRISPHQGLMDLIQTAAFKGGLANSVFCRKHQIDQIDSVTLNDYVDDYFRNERCYVASVGIIYEETIKFAEQLILPKIKCSAKKAQQEDVSHQPELRMISASTRTGYEVHDLGHSPVTWMAVAVPGHSLALSLCICFGSAVCILLYSRLLAHSVLAAACGTRNNIGHRRFLRSVQDPLGRLTVDDTTDHWAFNISYCDAGIFGVAARTASYQARDVGRRMLNFMNQGLMAITVDQVRIGKRRLIMDLMAYEESCAAQATSLAHALTTNAEVGESWLKVVESVDDSDVIKVAKHLSTITDCNFAFAVVGDIGLAPTDTELREH